MSSDSLLGSINQRRGPMGPRMPNDPPPDVPPSKAGRILLTSAILSSVLLVLSRIFLSMLDPGPALPGPLRMAFDTVGGVLPWLWGLATGILVWAAVYAVRHHHLTERRTWIPLATVGSALILAIWFPWYTLSYLDAFSVASLPAAGLAVGLGYVTYPGLRRRYSLGWYTCFLLI